ncbi:MAG: 16S rRNA processing protein RimM [Bradyrhizobium sp.]|nr:MAG: 16S rRNA processing protein RimM [Bradyrhizobium sp.]
MARLVLLGVFGAARGVRGEVRVKSYTADPKAIGAYGALTDKSGAKIFRFESLKPLGDDMLAAQIAGVATREAAEALTGVEIYARRDQLPPPAEDEFYYDDLVDLKAETRLGVALGRVMGLRNFGAGDILEIAPEGGGETMLLPFAKAVAVEIDFAGGRIVIEPPREIDGEREEEPQTE